ncbi:hypothetical protein [Bizionia paragorgiae]|uniref:Uncharacterized protein n=1 Tax=Bizionia paragorgiae TaxID=283786 RepID=A0A1H3YNL5_BIZPA|nr:hypothetical protein [Bizionia paragorgiae]SEA13093.1 hypothetical protein SAMN04487990_10717 [Bizionia paragorgiae]
MAFRIVDALSVSFLLASSGNILAGIGSACIILYYLSMLKINVINKEYQGRWKNYFTSFIRPLKKEVNTRNNKKT